MTPQVISLSSATSTAWIPVDYIQNPYNISLALVFSNTPNLTCKVEYTLDDVFNPLVTPTAFAHTSLTGITTNTTGSITYPIRAFRLTVTAWTSGTVTLTALQGVTNPQIYTTTGSGSLIYKFPSWPSNTGFLLASLVAGATASRTSNIVTITATAHGIPLTSTYYGFRFYYPGSTNLTAGWYDSLISIPDANTLTFFAPGVDFTSESINGGAAWTTITDIISTTIPANTLKDGSKVAVGILRGADNVASNKIIYLNFGGAQVQQATLTGVSALELKMGFRCLGSTKQFAHTTGWEGTNSSLIGVVSKSVTSDQALLLRGSLAAASMYLSIIGAHVEITQ